MRWYNMKVVKSLENRGILLKGTTRKIISQEGRLLNFLAPLVRVAVRLGLTTAASATDAAIQKKIFWIWHSCTDNLEQRNR